MPQFSMPLGKAHKTLERLVASSGGAAPRRGRRRFYGDDEPTGPQGVVVAHVSAVGIEAPDAEDELKRRAATALGAFTERLQLARDAAELKEAIFAANQESGASRVMMEISLQKAELAARTGALEALTQAHQDVVAANGIDAALVSRLRDALRKPEARDLSITLALFTAPELEGRIRTLRIELNRLDDDLRRLNGTTTVTVDLSDVGAAQAGLA